MKELDELIDDITLYEEDYLHIVEMSLTEEEYNTIKQLTLQKIKGQEKQDLIKPKKAMKKSLKIVLAAAILITSVTTFASTIGKGAVEELFRVIFGENTFNIGSSGIVVDANDYEKEINLHVTAALANRHAVNMLFELEKEKGQVFSGENIRFDEIMLNIEGIPETTAEGLISWQVYKEIHRSEVDEAKTEFQFLVSSIEEMAGKNVTLSIKNIIEYTTYKATSQIDLGEYLSQHPDYIVQDTIPNSDKRYDQQLIDLGDEEEIAFKESIPVELLPKRGLNLTLFSQFPEFRLDNIGFINQALHIRIEGSDKRFILEDEQGNQLEPIYTVTEGRRGYYVYPISDLQQLNHLKCFIELEEEINKTEGEWEVNFTLPSESEEKVMTPHIEVPLKSQEKVVINEIKISNLSLAITYTGDTNDLNSFDINLIFKNRPNYLVTTQKVYVHALTGSTKQNIYYFDKPINLAQINEVLVNNISVPLTKGF